MHIGWSEFIFVVRSECWQITQFSSDVFVTKILLVIPIFWMYDAVRISCVPFQNWRRLRARTSISSSISVLSNNPFLDLLLSWVPVSPISKESVIWQMIWPKPIIVIMYKLIRMTRKEIEKETKIKVKAYI